MSDGLIGQHESPLLILEATDGFFWLGTDEKKTLVMCCLEETSVKSQLSGRCSYEMFPISLCDFSEETGGFLYHSCRWRTAVTV